MIEQRTVPVVLDNGIGLVTVEGYETEAGELACGIKRIDGFLNEPPKQWLRTMRAEFEKICVRAKEAGFVEVRLCGRDWSKVFPELEPIDGLPNGLRKRLD